uniref:Uncharacterized protein n=1 Tax=Alexandrium monilatum TaxID=311494 RepID=A0A7S4QE27_9DINO
MLREQCGPSPWSTPRQRTWVTRFRLSVDSYIFQEYWNANQQEFTTRASWSAIAFSGVMRPQDTKGYCFPGAPGSLANLEGLTRAECKSRCVALERCRFASYSEEDFRVAKQDGSHCMLFDCCEARDTLLQDIWWTYEKVDVPTLAAVAFTEQCQHFKDQHGDDRTAVAAVHRLPGGPVEFEFDVGEDVHCAGGPRLLSAAVPRGMPRPPGLGTAEPALALAATPRLAASEEAALMFP